MNAPRAAEPPAQPGPCGPASETPWYADGLCFACEGCGKCCTGGPGYVWVSEAEIDAIAAYLRIERHAFRRQHLFLGYRGYSLREKPNYDCIFMEAGRCRIYPVRPRQCRSFPFWPDALRSPERWQHYASACPGMGRGRLYSLAEIQEILCGARDAAR